MNLVILMGRLTKDPEIRWTSGEKSFCVARFTLAVNRMKEGADFINCEVLGKSAEAMEKYVKKGVKLAVSGSWRTGSYKNKDGKTVYTNECAVTHWEFCESKGESKGTEEPEEPREKAPDGFLNVPDGIDEELPFA